MWCFALPLLVLLIVTNPLRWLRIGGSSDGGAWGRALGDWWDRHFPSREERERRTRGFDVKTRDEDQRHQ